MVEFDDAVISFSIYNDYSGDPPAAVEVFQCDDGSYVLAADDLGYGTYTSTLPAGTPADKILGEMQSQKIAADFDLGDIVSQLVASNENEYRREPTGGDEWTDNLAITFSVDDELLEALNYCVSNRAALQ